MNQAAEQNTDALSLITQPWHRDNITPCFCCCPGSHRALHGRAVPLQWDWLFEKFNYALKWTVSACGENGFQARAIYCCRNVPHIHEYWMDCATVGRLSPSLWFVFLPPPPLLVFHLDCNLLPRTRCTLLKTDFCLLLSSVGVRYFSGQALQRMMSDYVNVMHHHDKISTETCACTSLKATSKHSFFHISVCRARIWTDPLLRSLQFCLPEMMSM